MNYIENKFDIFDYKNLGSVRTHIDKDGNKWFCLVDVCNILDIRNSRDVAKRIEIAYVDTIDVGINTSVGKDGLPIAQQIPMTFVNESGLYQAIGRSRKPEAEKFMLWVFDEVLPSLNKKGYYVMSNKPKEGVIQELQNELNTVKEEISCINKMRVVHNDTIIWYASRNKYILSPELIKKLEDKAISEAKRFNDKYDTTPCQIYGTGYTTFPTSLLEYVFKHYYEKLTEEIK